MGCVKSVTRTQAVTIQKNPIANFIADTTFGCVPLSVIFDPSTSMAYPPATLSSFNWTFGDGSAPVVSANSNPIQHIYTTRSFPGSYSPTLNVTDSKGCSSSYSHNNYITPTFPYPNITIPNTICF